MKKTVLFWIIAVLLTLASAVYQRVTGPTYPVSGSVDLDGKKITYTLNRSWETSSDYNIEINTGDENISGTLYWRLFNSGDSFTAVPMTGGKTISAALPVHKTLTKLDYYIELSENNSKVIIPEEKMITLRFKDPVPIYILIPHIFAMFFAMMLSNRTGLEFFNKQPKLEKLTLWSVIILFIGGIPLGFAMNGFAFGEMWGGWPFGNDVTDNKTQIALLFWVIAYFMVKKNKYPKLAVLLAAIIMFAVYMIPHSV